MWRRSIQRFLIQSKLLKNKRRIKELKQEIEYQKIKNRSVSRGKMTKKDEEKLVEKFVEYNKKKWINRDNKIKQKEKIIEKEISGYFKPQISKSSKRLAQNKRAKEFGIITGGKIVQPNSTKK